MKGNRILSLAMALGVFAASLPLTACKRAPSTWLQGYVEGEYVYVASPYAGQLRALHVQRGTQTEKDAPLFELDSTAETAVRAEAKQRLSQSQATLEDAKKGRRPSEVESLQAQVQQAREAVSLSNRELARQENLTQSGAIAAESIDRARSTHLQNRQRVTQIEADLKTAQLGQRSDQIAAAEAEVHAREAALAKAEWDISQKQQRAPQAGLVFDTLYRAGEWVPAGRPVVSLLPPASVKVRTFVPETRLGGLHAGDKATVRIDGMDAPQTATISFISPQAEYTPPVIYSQENRSKLVFMIELRFEDAVAVKLHPGQPVDVDFPARP